MTDWKPERTIKPPSDEVLAIIREQFTYDPSTGTVTRNHPHFGRKVIQDRTSIRRGKKGKATSFTAAQVAWYFTHDAWPARMIEHVDHNSSNNRPDNLRYTTWRQSARKRAKKSETTSQYKGVSHSVRKRRRSCWIACIWVDGVGKRIGSFQSEEEAARAYDWEAFQAFGFDAHLNFPDQPLIAPSKKVKPPPKPKRHIIDAPTSGYNLHFPSDEVLAILRRECTYDPVTGVLLRRSRLGLRQIKRSATIKGFKAKIHHVAWFFVHGTWPTRSIDHIDHNKKNNRISNLRLAGALPNGQNKQKSRKPKASKYKGVSVDGEKWIARITTNGILKHIGTFLTQEEAARAYDAEAVNLHGEFASLNFDDKPIAGDSPIVIPTPTAEERFWAKVDKRDAEKCWRWLAGAKRGYGRFDGMQAHRYSYELVRGKIPDGLMLLHSCDHPWCVNPYHLTPGTAEKNMQEALERGLLNPAKGESAGHAKLREVDIPIIRRRYDLGERPSSIVKDYPDVSAHTISSIGLRHTWQHVPEEEDAPNQEHVLFPNWDEVQATAGAGVSTAGTS